MLPRASYGSIVDHDTSVVTATFDTVQSNTDTVNKKTFTANGRPGKDNDEDDESPRTVAHNIRWTPLTAETTMDENDVTVDSTSTMMLPLSNLSTPVRETITTRLLTSDNNSNSSSNSNARKTSREICTNSRGVSGEKQADGWNKTYHGSFYEDTKAFSPGSLPHSIVLALIIGTLCGLAAWLYHITLNYLLQIVWHDVPLRIIALYEIPESWHILWIPLVAFVMAVLVAGTVHFIGEPGDMPFTVRCVHEQGYISMNHVTPMTLTSLLSMLGGSSVGPEAPLVAICAALAGWISRTACPHNSRNLVRKHTLMGMAAALAAFFGVPLGGALFALEITSPLGVEYAEHAVEAILCGQVSMVVFRHLTHQPVQHAIWNITNEKITTAHAIDVVSGAWIGLVGALLAWIFSNFHRRVVMKGFRSLGVLDDSRYALSRILLGSVVVVVFGMTIPHTMFWGESEFQVIAALQSSSTLDHVWPTKGLCHFELQSFSSVLLLGCAKLITISFSIAGGYRGGYIFPIFAAAAAFGRALYFLFPAIPLAICVLSLAAALLVALTRTVLGTTLILATLAGEPALTPTLLAASLTSLLATAYVTPFIATQRPRCDWPRQQQQQQQNSNQPTKEPELHANNEMLMVEPKETVETDESWTSFEHHHHYHAPLDYQVTPFRCADV